jgi:hypothetical protein
MRKLPSPELSAKRVTSGSWSETKEVQLFFEVTAEKAETS